MNGSINGNELTIVKKNVFGKPIVQKRDFLIDNCSRDRRNLYFHTSEYKCVSDYKITQNGIFEIVNLTFSDKSVNMYGFEKNLTNARQKDFTFIRQKKYH